MPSRLNARPPGEFIRDHLLDRPAQRDFVGGMFRAYKGHLRAGGVQKIPCRATFHTYIWMLKEVGAIIFDGAEPVSFFGDEPPATVPADYVPGVASC